MTFARSANSITQAKTASSPDIVSGTATGEAEFGAGTYSITYDYVTHAQPTLNSIDILDLTLDFGTLILNSGPVTLNFIIRNLGDASTTDLNFDGFIRQVGNSNFSTDLAPFSNLAAGDLLTFSMTFDPLTLGTNTEDFDLYFADHVPTGGVGGRDYVLNLTTKAEVVAGAVPEAATWAMMILGFGAVGAAARRQRRPTAA